MRVHFLCIGDGFCADEVLPNESGDVRWGLGTLGLGKSKLTGLVLGLGWRCLLGGSLLGRSVNEVSGYVNRAWRCSVLTICNAGLASSSSSRSQQERRWRNQSPIFSFMLSFVEYMSMMCSWSRVKRRKSWCLVCLIEGVDMLS